MAAGTEHANKNSTMKQNPILDTRDLEKRRAELQSLADTLEEAMARLLEIPGTASPDSRDLVQAEAESAAFEFAADERKELEELDSLESEVPEWYDGAALIPVDGWVDYCHELLYELGELPRDLPDYIAIDWEETADNLKADYSECEYQGETYLYRNC